MKGNHIAVGLFFMAVCMGIGLLMAISGRSSSTAGASANSIDASAAPASSEAALIAENAERLDTTPPQAIEVPTIEASSQTATTGSISQAWLEGTWGPAAHNPRNDPNSSCDTDMIVTFGRNGTYVEGSGSYGRYRTDGRTITYFNRVMVELESDVEDRSQFDQPMTSDVTVVDQNTFRENGEAFRRCRSG